MKRIKIAIQILTFISIAPFCLAQDVFHNCPLGGDNPRMLQKDSLKNRYLLPSSYKIMNLEDLQKMKYNTIFSNQLAVEVTGWVILVKDGGSETCNCHTTDKTLFDTHIEIVPDSNHREQKDAVIVEITPRVREQKKALGIDWSTKSISKQFLGKKVSIKGYIFNDSEHRSMSLIDGSTLKNTHRATCIEVHPVFEIEIIK